MFQQYEYKAGDLVYLIQSSDNLGTYDIIQARVQAWADKSVTLLCTGKNGKADDLVIRKTDLGVSPSLIASRLILKGHKDRVHRVALTLAQRHIDRRRATYLERMEGAAPAYTATAQKVLKGLHEPRAVWWPLKK